MEEFAKLFSAPDTGQVLVMLDLDQEIPQIQIIHRPMGVFSEVLLEFPQTQQGTQRAVDVFHELDEETALSMVRKTLAGPLLNMGASRSIH